MWSGGPLLANAVESSIASLLTHLMAYLYLRNTSDGKVGPSFNILSLEKRAILRFGSESSCDLKYILLAGGINVRTNLHGSLRSIICGAQWAAETLPKILAICFA